MGSLSKRAELGSSQCCIMGGWDTIISWKEGYSSWLYKLLHHEDSEQQKRLLREIVLFLLLMVFKNRWNKVLSREMGPHGWPLHATGWTRHLLSYSGRKICHFYSTMEILNSVSGFFFSLAVLKVKSPRVTFSFSAISSFQKQTNKQRQKKVTKRNWKHGITLTFGLEKTSQIIEFNC